MIAEKEKPEVVETGPETITVKEFAEIMGWERSTVTRAINTGRIQTTTKRLPGLRRVAEHRILKSEVERLRKEAGAGEG